MFADCDKEEKSKRNSSHFFENVSIVFVNPKNREVSVNVPYGVPWPTRVPPKRKIIKKKNRSGGFIEFAPSPEHKRRPNSAPSLNIFLMCSGKTKFVLRKNKVRQGTIVTGINFFNEQNKPVFL